MTNSGLGYLSDDLFDVSSATAPSAIPGLRYLPNFIDADTETALLTTID